LAALNADPHEIFCNNDLTGKGLPALGQNILPVTLRVEAGDQRFPATGFLCDPTCKGWGKTDKHKREAKVSPEKWND